MPSLGSYMCEQFVTSLLHFYTLRTKNTLPTDSSYSSPVHLLVKTSLLTEDQNITSFPEFVRSLKGGMKVSWCGVVLTKFWDLMGRRWGGRENTNYM
jgi:hypothetical protein